MRLFIAIDLDESSEYFKEVQSHIDKSLGKMSFTFSYHVTLKFLPDFRKEEVPLLLEKLRGMEFEKFDIKMSEVGYFSNKFGPSVIWQGVESSELLELQKKIDSVIKETSDFEFHPHITLARVKYNKDSARLIENIKEIKTVGKTFKVDKIVLYLSKLTKDGAIYKVLGEFNAT